MKEFIKTDKNGTKYFNERVTCDRCGGDGVYKWGAMISYGGAAPIPQYSGVCYKCNGAGKVWEIVKEYTPEYRAKLDAANEKRKQKQREKWEAERAEREAERQRIEAEKAAERARKEAERLAEIERNRGNFIGEVGQRIEMTVTYIRSFSYEVPHPVCDWKTQTITGYVFKTDDGNTLVWKTSGSLGYWKDNDRGYQDWISPEEGDRVTIKGTIKDHQEFNNVNQTLLNRVKWVA